VKKRTRNILIIVSSVFLVLGGLSAYGVYRIYKYVVRFSTPPELPAEIKEARVLKGGDFLTKKEFFKLNREGLLKTVAKGGDMQRQLAKRRFNFSDLKVIGNEIVAVGEFGGYVFELNGKLKREVVFDLMKERAKIGPFTQDEDKAGLENIRIVRLETNVFGFLAYGSMQGVRVFDANGHQLWANGQETFDLGRSKEEREAEDEKRTYVLEAAVGDLDNDGISEYIVTKRKDGIHAFDRTGRELWSKPADHPSEPLLVLDVDGDGRNELVQVGAYVRAGISGEFIRETKGGSYGAVLFVPDQAKGTALQYCDVRGNSISCTDEKGDVFLGGEAPLNEVTNPEPPVEDSPIPYQYMLSIADPRAVWVALRKDQPKYLAVVGAYIGLPRAHLYIYEPNGTLVYHELLPEEAQTIAVVPGVDGVEGLLVGGKDTIWKYGN
jgi:hypothetical protein